MKIEMKYLTVQRLLMLAASGDVSEILEFHATLPSPPSIRVGVRQRAVPADLSALLGRITFAQKKFLEVQPKNDFDAVLRMFRGYYYPELFPKEFKRNAAKRKAGKEALGFEAASLKAIGKAKHCYIAEIVPAMAHIARLVSELNKLEEQLLAADVDPIWLQAGGKELEKYAARMTVEFIAEKLKCGLEEVFDNPYAQCLQVLAERATMAKVERRFHKIIEENLKTPKR